jgi:hypothetical protein
MSPETERGFGTGLRAQLQRKQDEAETNEAPPQPEAAAAAELEASGTEEQFLEPVEEPPFDDHVNVVVQASVPELAELRSELEAALRREQDLRDALQHQIEVREHDLEASRDLALREAEAEQAATRVSAREGELERREQVLADQLEQIANERREVNLHRTELVAEEARLAELGVQVDSMHADLEFADHDRAQAAADLARQLGMLADRERELKRERTELDQRRADAIAKEDALRTRDEATGAREREIERIQSRLQERAEAVAERETVTGARLNKLEAELADREAAVGAWEERVRSQAERAERERTGHGRAAQEAFALMAELEQRENALKLREVELARAAAARENDTKQADQREQLVARGEASLSTLREELELRVDQTEKRELEVARRTSELQEGSDELRLREARLGAELELRAEKLDQLEDELAERDRRLAERERDLASYVGELQRTVA